MSAEKNMCSNKTVVAIGKFDGVHTGHQKLLNTAVSLAGSGGLVSLCLVVAPDKTPSLCTCAERESLVYASGIDRLYMQNLTDEFMSMSPHEFVDDYLIKKLNCAHVVVGYNFRFAKGRCANADDLKMICVQKGIECTVIPEVKCSVAGKDVSVSSSNIRSFLQNGRVEDASLLLGRNYSLSGMVVHGKQIGRTLDFPTANIEAECGRIVPQNGVYAGFTYVDGKCYQSVTNIGDNPTVNNVGNITVESHIIGFSDNIYGKCVTVEFAKKIRDEKKFSSLEELKEQIKKDKEYVIDMLFRRIL